MSKTIMFLFATLLLLSAPQARAQDAEALSFCSGLGQLSTAILQSRDNGVPPIEMITALHASVAEARSGDPEMDEMIRELYTALVMDAYDLPSFRTPEMQAQQQAEFRAEIETWCLSIW